MGAATTAFVTDPGGIVGAELISTLVARGHDVLALAPSADVAARIRRAGAIAVAGNLARPGRWQDEVAADWVFHLPPPVDDHRPGPAREADALARVSIDRHVFDAVAAGTTRRLVYVASLARYRASTMTPITENELPAPCVAEGRQTSPLDCLEGYVLAGLPIVTGIPGCIYGSSGWFRDLIAAPVMAGRRIAPWRPADHCVTPIHVHDCARALVHLAERGAIGRRYFVANSEPARLDELAETFARVANRPLRTWPFPAVTRLLTDRRPLPCGPLDTVLSNHRLRRTGFEFQYPTVEQGCRQILRTFHD
jgi:nucleoside-diphosphate-sugar epimerase